MPEQIFVPVRRYVQSLLPVSLFELPEIEAFDHVWMEPPNIQTDPSVDITTALLFKTDLALGIPGLDAFKLVVAPSGAQTVFMLHFESDPTPKISLVDMPLALRFSQDLLKPVRRVPGQNGEPDTWEVDPERPFVDITLAKVTLSTDFDGNVNLKTDLALDMPPAMIADTGVVVEARDIGIYLDASNPPPGKPAGWKGIHIGHAAVHLPGGLSGTIGTLEMTDAYIGNGGFSGTVSDTWTPALAATMFGMQFSLQHVEVTFVQNSLTAAGITGQVMLPFFDELMDVEICLSLNGTFTVRLSAPGGLITLTKAGILILTVESLGFETANGQATVSLSGQITPLVGGLDWPTFKVKELSIDSHGNVHLDGGWLDLPDQYTLDFYGFQITISKIGFGKTDDGGKWIGFSGGLKLVDGLSAGASVEGLRITWHEGGTPSITLNGVGVELEIPDVLRFKGAVSYHDLPGDVHRFDGSIDLELTTLGLEITGVLVIGSAPGYTFFAIYLDAELPAGIPLFNTGLALYGMAGLFALNMKPDKTAEQPWYEIDGTTDWYHTGQDGVTDLATKWTNDNGALALGAGITIGTLADNGFTFSGKVLLVISFPGPVLLIQGSANLLKERASLTEEAIFRAIAVLDFRAGTFLLGVDAQYKYDDSGQLIDIRGGTEAFFSLSDPGAWHLYVGLKDPREKRIRAEIFQLFEANVYFMLDAHQLATGAWIGYAKHWSFGPLSVTVEAWIEGNAVVSWKPVHLYGDLWLHGKAELKVFGFGLGLSVDARLAANVFDPFSIKGDFSVSIDLPWPLPDFGASITLEWGPTPNTPPLPLPLKEVAVEHFKVTTSWPLPRTGAQPLLRPNYDGNGDGFREDPDRTPAAQESDPPPAFAPVVPLDARPHITFGRPVHDPAMIGVNAQPVTPEWERIGDPALNKGPVRVKYSLTEVVLHKYDGGAWTMTARKGATPNPAGVQDLFGSWADVPAMPDGGGTNSAQVKLWLWSKSPFDYTRHSSKSWDEWFTDRFSDYPCLPPPLNRQVCCDFDGLDPAQTIHPPFFCSDKRFTISWMAPDPLNVTKLLVPVAGKKQALCFPAAVAGIYTQFVRNLIEVRPPEPAKEVQLWVSGGEGQEVKDCVDFRGLPNGEDKNPREERGVTFTVMDSHGKPAAFIRIIHALTGGEEIGGLDGGFELIIDLPCAASLVSLLLTRSAAPAKAEAFETDGTLSDAAEMQGPSGQAETIELQGKAITRVVVHSPKGEVLLHQVCYVCQGSGNVSVQAIGYDDQDNAYGPFYAQNQVIDVLGNDMTHVSLISERGFCLVQVCVTIGPSKAELAEREAMMQHTRDELARWQQTGAVFQPHSQYRLKIVTLIETADNPSLGTYDQIEFAYFRTGDPPGLDQFSVPIGQDAANFKSGLEDLAIYVRQTVPATVPPPGAMPLLPRPVYRGYDVGVEFNEDYVDLMYRIDGRDLGLYLYDSNNRPVRDAQGRLVVLSNRWGRAENLSLSESDKLWISTINTSDCAMLDTTTVPHTNTLSVRDGQVLDADFVYEARLVPLLLHEAFSAFTAGTAAVGPAGILGRWKIADEGVSGGPSRWEIGEEGTPPARFVRQTTNIWGGTVASSDPSKPGSLLLYCDDLSLPSTHTDQPGNWTDVRFSAYLRSGDDDAIGLVFRYQSAGNCYRFSMDRERKYRRLVRLVGGIHTVLAEDEFVYTKDQDYLITVEMVGSSLRIYQDGVLVFDVTDTTLDYGRVGLYCWADQGARFSDIRVDDFCIGAPVAYRFKFTTSSFVSFFHCMHSYQDEIWRVDLPAGTDITPEVLQAVAAPTIPVAPIEAESRSYEGLADKVLGQTARQNPPEVQVTRFEQDGRALGLLLRSPEPVDWQRAVVQALHAERATLAPDLPGKVKLTDVSFGSNQPHEEVVTLLLRDAMDLSRTRIESRRLPGPLAESVSDPLLFADDFRGSREGLLFRETFGPNALDHYRIVDEGNYMGPSAWSVSGGAIVQSSNIYGGSLTGSVPDKPGSMALTGSDQWGDVRIRARFHSLDNDAIGIVFRYQDATHYYRFSMDRERSYRRLVKKVGSAVTVLWEDAVAYNVSQAYNLEILAWGDRLIGYLDGVLLFNVSDATIKAGQVGLYCWGDQGAYFDLLEIETLECPPLLWQPSFNDLTGLQIVDEPEAVGGPSQWAGATGEITQSSSTHVIDGTAAQPGTYVLGGSIAWGDVRISVGLNSTTGDAIGVIFRYYDANNYYRFSMDANAGYRRLVKKFGGIVSVLWQDVVAYIPGSRNKLTLLAVGSQISAYVDSVLLFTIQDRDLKQGQVGLYCSNNTSAHFDKLVVVDETRLVGNWEIHDEGTSGAPSTWLRNRGALLQTSAIYSLATAGYEGTTAVAGDSSWRDYRLEVRLRSDTDQAIGVVFRYQDEDNYYRFSLNRVHNYRRLVKKVAGVFTMLWQDSSSYTSGSDLMVTVDAIGGHLVGYLGGVRLFDVNDSGLATGQVGLYCSANSGARFTSVEVSVPPLEAFALLRDRFESDDLSDWSFVDEGTLQGPSIWAVFQGALRQTNNIYTPPIDRNTLNKLGTLAAAGDLAWKNVVISVQLQSFDDDAIGVVFRYQDINHYYRFSMDSQRGYRRLVKNVGGTFTLLWEDSTSYQVGTAYELTVVAEDSTLRGFMDGLPLFVVEDSGIVAGRIGLYCWGNNDARFSQVRVYPISRSFSDWLLDDPFDVQRLGAWTFVDEGDQNTPSQWAVTNGELCQTSMITGGDVAPAAPEKPGTYAIAAQSAREDYRFSVRLRSDTDQAIGVVFRYQDKDDYYCFSMDRAGSYRRLVKKVGGVVTAIWEDNVAYTMGREYLMTVDCLGDSLTGYLDSVQLFSLDDTSLTSGKLGLYCWNNSGACFAEARATVPVWTVHYAFGHEDVMAAGTRVRVYSGNASAAPAIETGILQRFVASLDEKGSIQFHSWADLRVVVPGETRNHRRTFLPHSDYTALGIRILRKADGTGLFVLAPDSAASGVRLNHGQYRLQFTFLRDNLAADPKSQVLSQAGDTHSEEVFLDIPWNLHS